MTDTRLFRRRAAMGGLALALLLLIVGTSPGREAAADLLANFRNDQRDGAALDTTEIADIEQALSELSAVGTISGIEAAPEPQRVESVAAANRLAGFPVIEPDPATLPEGFEGEPVIVRVTQAFQVRFTVDLETARGHYESSGSDDVDLPERFDGASLVVDVPPVVLLQYRDDDGQAGAPAGFGLVLGQTETLGVRAEGGVSLEDLQEFLLDLPGLSPETERQLTSIDDWQTTLPVPLPIARVNWERATIDGNPGLLLDDNSGLGSAAIWQRDGRVFGLAGTMKAGKLQDVAESLR